MSYWHAILDTSPFGMMNMQWNLGMEKMRYQMSLFSNPFTNSMSFLLDPNYAIWQCQQRWNNNPWATQKFNNNNFINNSWWNNTTNPYTPSNNNTPSSARQTASQKELTKLKNLFASLEKINDSKNGTFVSAELIDEYNDAIKDYEEVEDENGKKTRRKRTDEDKLTAVKAVMQKIGVKKLKAAVLETKEIKDKLRETGYNFKASTETLNKDEDKHINDALNKLESDLKAGHYGQLNIILGNDSPNRKLILQIMSKWNDTHNKDGKNYGILRMAADNLPSDCAGYKVGIDNLVSALTERANTLDTTPQLSKKIQAVVDALGDVDKEFDSSNGDKVKNIESLKSKLRTLSDKVDTLYAQVRMQEAAALNKDIREKYADSLNSIISNAIPDDIIISNTRADLESEKLSVPDIEEIEEQDFDNDNEHEYETAEERVSALIDSGKIVETDKSKSGAYGEMKVYKSKGRDENGKPQYFIIQDGELVKLNGWLDGNKKLHDASGKVICEDITKDLKPEHYSEFSDSDIETKDKKAEKEQQAKEAAEEAKNKANASAEELKNAQSGTVKTMDSDARNEMNELAAKQGLKKSNSGVRGYFYKTTNDKKNPYKYYRYDIDTKTFVECPNIKKINKDGTITTKSGKTMPVRQIGISPEAAGTLLRQLLEGDTESADYDNVMRIMNSFSTYTDPKDIVDFIKGYDNERGTVCIPFNGRISAQISSENNFGLKRKAYCLQIIAKQMMKVMDKLGYDPDDEKYRDFEFYATQTSSDSTSWRRGGNRFLGLNWFGKGWSFWSSSRTGAANHMDNMIRQVLTKWDDKNPTNDSENEEQS